MMMTSLSLTFLLHAFTHPHCSTYLTRTAAPLFPGVLVSFTDNMLFVVEVILPPSKKRMTF
jgi:hypothetical protein